MAGIFAKNLFFSIKKRLSRAAKKLAAAKAPKKKRVGRL